MSYLTLAILVIYYLFAIGYMWWPSLFAMVDQAGEPKKDERLSPYFVVADQGPDLAHLPDLLKISWPRLHRPNTSDPEASVNIGAFDVMLSRGHRKSIEKLLDVFQANMVKAKLNNQWFLLAGTLIGSVRHHDIVPWDEDVDVGIHIKYREQVGEVFRKLAPDIEFHQHYDRDKINLKPLNASAGFNQNLVGSFKTTNYPWAWPFIDIWYHDYIGNGTAVAIGDSSFSFRVNDVYPLTYRPLGKRWYPAPCRPINFLNMYYQSDPWACDTGNYLHTIEVLQPVYRKDCRDLAHKYAFVQRCPRSFLQAKNEPNARKLLNSMIYADEHLINGNNEIVHTIRTVVNFGAIARSGYSARPRFYDCFIRK